MRRGFGSSSSSNRTSYQREGSAMTDGRQDQAWPAAMQWDLRAMRGHVNETLWRCEALRAGKLYSSSVFGSRDEAEAFALRMRETEPDQTFRVEAILASAVWN